MQGAKKAGILSDAQAEEVFGWIEKSQRYSFNKSHAVSYGLLGYDTAYVKAHFPVAFFANWLYFAKDKSDPRAEIAELVQDAKLFDVPVEPPDLRTLEDHFSTDGVVVRFGLADVRGVGGAQMERLRQGVYEAQQRLGRPLADWCWEHYLYHASHRVSANINRALIAAGAFAWTGKSRTRLLNEFGSWDKLTEKEQEFVRAQCDPQAGLMAGLRALGRPKKEGGGVANAKRVLAVQSELKLLQEPPSSENDTPNFIAWAEELYLGIPLTCSRVDACDASAANCTCKEFLTGRTGYLLMAVEVKQAREVRTKKGKNPGQKMAFLTLADASCALDDVTVFPDSWKKYGRFLRPGNTVLVEGEREAKKDAFIVNHVWELV
jgi:DNA polymerase-3 subunit alpha